MSGTKIHLSQHELSLVTDAGFILTKNEIIRKLSILLQELQERQQKIIEINPGLPPEILGTSYKISKGENYKGLPWVVLDHPRWFRQDNIFAIRTLFWWGNYFSTTLHLSGEFKQQLEENIFASFKKLGEQGFYLSISEDQWQHHFNETNYLLLNELDKDEISKQRGKPFLKIAKKIPLEQMEWAIELLSNDYEVIIKIVGDQLLPRR